MERCRSRSGRTSLGADQLARRARARDGGGAAHHRGLVRLAVRLALGGDGPWRSWWRRRHVSVEGDFEGPLVLDTNDEFARLAETLNEASRELSASRARLESETQARVDALDQVRRADQVGRRRPHRRRPGS